MTSGSRLTPDLQIFHVGQAARFRSDVALYLQPVHILWNELLVRKKLAQDLVILSHNLTQVTVPRTPISTKNELNNFSNVLT